MAFTQIPLLLIALPFALYGFATNFIPYFITSLLSKKIEVRADFVGSLQLAAGMFMFLIFYILQFVALNSFFGFAVSLAISLSFYPTGLFTVFYLRITMNLITLFRHLQLFRRKSTLMSNLKDERDEILAIFNKQEEARTVPN